MGKGGTSVPPPPPISAEEQSFLRQQNLTLQDLRGMLTESRVQQQETQNILKDFSGLYDRVDIPESRTPGKTETAFSQAKADAYINATPRTVSKADPTGEGGVERARRRQQVDMAKSDLGLASQLGIIDTQTTPETVTAARTEYKVNNEKVADLRKKLGDYDAKLEELGNQSLEAEGKALEQLQQQISQNLELQKQTYEKLQSEIGRPPTEFEQAQERIGLLQADRLEKALRGELPVSEASRQRKEQEFQSLREAASQRGIQIEGDSPDTATSNSTAGIQQLGEFNRTFKLLEDAERRGEISAGAGENLARYGLQGGLQNQGFNQAYSLRGMAAAPQAGMTYSPGAQSLSFLQGAAGYSPMNLAGGYTGLLQGYQTLSQPYYNQRMAQYNSAYQNAALRSQGRSGLSSLLGYGGGAALMSGNPMLGGSLIGAGALLGL